MKTLLLICWLVFISSIGVGQEVCYAPYGGPIKPEFEITNLLITVN